MTCLRGRREARDGDQGTAVWLMPFVGLLVLAALALAFQGGVLVAQRRVQAAADLAALAGASALQGAEDGCAAASTVAQRNGATLTSCSVQGAVGHEILVTVVRDGPELMAWTVEVRASARAGPDTAP